MFGNYQSRSRRASLLVLSGQWQDMPARECLTESGRLEALATYATQLPKRCIHHQTHFEHFQALLERPYAFFIYLASGLITSG